MTTTIFWASDTERYAGFWQRLGALVIDALVTLPFIWFHLLFFRTRTGAMFAFIPSLLFGLWFYVYLVYRYGGTPGKLLIGIRIVDIDGSPVRLTQAFLRHSPSIFFACLGAISLFLSIGHISEETWVGLAWRERSRMLRGFAPPWDLAVGITSQIWGWSEVVVMLTNPERRALHDFLAGTIVIKKL